MADTPARRGAAGGSAASGTGRLLVALYGLFALAATSRAAVQIIEKFDRAPLAYTLSALAAAVYVVATLAIARGARWHRVAVAACTFELVGVLAVGTASLLVPAAFPDATVWSGYGEGYLLIPLFLPVLGLVYLRSTRLSPPRDRRERPAPPP